MLHKSTIICIVLAAGVLYSCGTNKKLQTAETQINDLQAKNNELEQTVASQKKNIADLSSRNQAMAEEYARNKAICEANEERLRVMRASMIEEVDQVRKVEERLKEALQEFEERGLDVYDKDGVIYVDMQDALLYKVGSAKLSPDGEKALGNLASVLNEFPKLKVTVVGNTDTAHVKGVADNWSLSTERANGVVRILSKTHNIDPARLMAAGKSKFNPVADNSTAEGRAKNRRTEIVLNPDWERIWNSAKSEQ